MLPAPRPRRYLGLVLAAAVFILGNAVRRWQRAPGAAAWVPVPAALPAPAAWPAAPNASEAGRPQGLGGGIPSPDGSVTLPRRRARSAAPKSSEAALPRPMARSAAPPPSRPAAPPALAFELAFELAEGAAEAGLVNVAPKLVPHPLLENIAPYLASIGAGVAVVDYDGDGWQDVYLTNTAPRAKNRLFRNNRDGTFADVAASAGLAEVNSRHSTMRPLFFDFENDGDKDLVLTSNWCPVVLRNDGGRFRDVTEGAGIRHCGVSFASNALDYDGDGDLDLVIGDYYKGVDFIRFDPPVYDFMQNSLTESDNGGPILVYRNNGDGTFAPAPGNLGVTSRGWTQAIGAYDLRGTGRPDLYFATDFNSDQVYFNEGGGRFTPASEGVADRFSRNGMSAEVADVDNDGRPAVFVSNIFEPAQRLGENTLWQWTGGKTFRNLARSRGVAECGWAWGAKFLDLDNDGWQDLAVTNGFISGDPKKNYWFAMTTVGSSMGLVLEDARHWPPIGDASFSGHQKKCVYRNEGGRFRDVTNLTGLKDDRGDGRGLAAIDVLNDGSLSLIETVQGGPLRFYRNRQRNKNRWLGFALTGTRSNRDAWGARVTVRLKGTTLRRQLQPGNGFVSQSDGRLHFGLGADPVLESVEVLWPSGRRQTLSGLALDRYHAIREE